MGMDFSSYAVKLKKTRTPNRGLQALKILQNADWKISQEGKEFGKPVGMQRERIT